MQTSKNKLIKTSWYWPLVQNFFHFVIIVSSKKKSSETSNNSYVPCSTVVSNFPLNRQLNKFNLPFYFLLTHHRFPLLLFHNLFRFRRHILSFSLCALVTTQILQCVIAYSFGHFYELKMMLKLLWHDLSAINFLSRYNFDTALTLKLYELS